MEYVEEELLGKKKRSQSLVGSSLFTCLFPKLGAQEVKFGTEVDSMVSSQKRL